MRRQPNEALGADGAPCIRHGGVLLPHVHAVGDAGVDEVGAVVEHEERAVSVAGAPERHGRGDELVVGELLVSELDDVHAAAEGGVEERGGILPVRARLDDEVEARAGEPLPAGRAVHGASLARIRSGETGARAAG